MRRILSALGAAMFAGLGAAPVQSADSVTLTIQHFLSPKSATQTDFIEPWAKRVEEQSQGRIRFEIFPSMAMGGKPPELYRQARDGSVDIVWTVLGYTPGAFPRAEVFELAGVHRGSARATTLAIQDVFADHLASEFTDVKTILVHTHAGNAFHMVSKPVRGLADLKGLKLRTPTRTGAWMIESWGADPVGMPVPELPQALSKGVVDGALIPFEVAIPLKVHELTRYSVEGAQGERFGTAVFLYAMNRGRYEALPAELKAVIDANSGSGIAAWAGEVWDRIEAPAKALVEGRGNEIVRLDDAALAAFAPKTEETVARWVAEVTSKGIDGAALVAAARAAVAAHTAP